MKKPTCEVKPTKPCRYNVYTHFLKNNSVRSCNKYSENDIYVGLL